MGKNVKRGNLPECQDEGIYTQNELDPGKELSADDRVGLIDDRNAMPIFI